LNETIVFRDPNADRPVTNVDADKTELMDQLDQIDQLVASTPLKTV